MLEMQYLVNQNENKVVTSVKDYDGMPLYELLDDLTYDTMLSGCITPFYMGNKMDEDKVNSLIAEYKDENLKLVNVKQLFELTIKLGK